MQKMRLFHWFVLEIWLIKGSCNLTGWEHFGPYLRNKNFPKYGICCRNIANYINFHYRTNSVKINDKFFNKLKKKPVFFGPFLVHFPNFGDKTFFLENLAVTHNLIWIPSTTPKFRKYKWYNPKKMPRQKDRRTDRPHFIGLFRLPPGVKQIFLNTERSNVFNFISTRH